MVTLPKQTGFARTRHTEHEHAAGLGRSPSARVRGSNGIEEWLVRATTAAAWRACKGREKEALSWS